jgi:hypothetical protein
VSEAPAPIAKPTFVRANREVVLVYLSIGVVIAGWIFLYFIGQYALIGNHPFQFFADSSTYHDIYSGFLVTAQGFIGISYNFLGPLLILTATGGNIYLIMVANVIMFSLSLIFICRALGTDPLTSFFIQFISPMTASSLLSVNKEIIVFPVLALLINGYRHRSPGLIAAAVVVSMLARWQLTAFCLILICLYFVRNANRYAILSALLLTTSISYYIAQDLLAPVLENVEFSTSSYTEGSGSFEILLNLQNDGLYFLVAPIKAAHLLFSMGTRFDLMFDPIIVYNDQVTTTYCFVNMVLFVALIMNGYGAVRHDLIMISLVYLIVFALTPIYSPRYFYAVTVLWGLALAGAKAGIPVDQKAPGPVHAKALGPHGDNNS